MTNEKYGRSAEKERQLSVGEMASLIFRWPGHLAMTRSLREVTVYRTGFTCQHCPAALLSNLPQTSGSCTHIRIHTQFIPSLSFSHFLKPSHRARLPLLDSNKIQIWLLRPLTVWISL